MAHQKSHAKPGSSVTRKVSQGPNKGDTVQFKANTSKAALPGKLNPRRVVRDTGKRNTSSLPRGRAKK